MPGNIRLRLYNVFTEVWYFPSWPRERRGAGRGEILTVTPINAPTDIQTHLGGIDDRESNLFWNTDHEEKMCLQQKRALFSSRAKELVLEHHEGSICARACTLPQEVAFFPPVAARVFRLSEWKCRQPASSSTEVPAHGRFPEATGVFVCLCCRKKINTHGCVV